MADQSSQGSRIGRTYSVISDITVAPIRMTTQDISNWKDAVNAARDIRIPRRRLLYELYDNIGIDGKVITVKQKRKVALTNKEFVFYKTGAAGKPVESIQDDLINTFWFDEMLEMLEEEDFYGHELMEFVPGTKTPIERVIQIPHANVVPETGLLLPNYMDVTNGIPFRGPDADPQINKYLLEYGKYKNYGLMMSISQYVIYKRGGFGDWAQFAELFGMPFRVGKYNPLDPTSRNLLNQALKNMGGAGYAVIPEGTTLEFNQSNYGSGQSGIFKDLIKECNDEIAQIGLGGTMTTIDGSSHSQSETHQKGEDSITAARLKKALKFLNGPFKKLAIAFGYGECATGYFTVEGRELVSLKDRILIDKDLNDMIEIKPDYFYDTYNVPMPEGGAKAKEKPVKEEPPKDDNKKDDQKKKAKLSLRLNSLYKQSTCKSCLSKAASLNLATSSDAEIERLARLIYDKKLKSGSIDKKLLKRTAQKLMAGINTGYLRSPGAESFTVKDEQLLSLMQEHVYVFSGFKTHKQLREASALLLDDKGAVKTFADFKNSIIDLDRTYNVNYLATEYNLAVASGQMASKWISFENLKADFPNWQYNTAGDDRVRPLHAALDKKVFVIGNPETDILFPPNGFGCRCDADATDETVSDKFDFDAKQLGMFNNNVGVSGIVFPPSHPYYEASQATTERITKVSKSLIPVK